MTMKLRSASTRDSAVLARLVSELGYESTEAQLEDRLVSLLGLKDRRLIVAEIDGEVVGAILLALSNALHLDGLFLRVDTVVVSEQHRGQKIGTALLNEAESIAKSVGAMRVVVTTASHREIAQKFYERNGYEATGIRYVKLLES